jgi:hypothetical protein
MWVGIELNFTISCLCQQGIVDWFDYISSVGAQQLSNRIASVRISAPEPFFDLVTASSHEGREIC